MTGRRLLRRSSAALGLLLLLALAVGSATAWTGLGKRASGARLARMQKSPQWQGGAFENPQPLHNDLWGSFDAVLSPSPAVRPSAAVPYVASTRERFATPPATGLRVTWFGHSSTLIELDGARLLTDPVWSERVSPVSWTGPVRWFPTPLPFEELPEIHGVLISHDHYDHLDHRTLQRMAGWKGTRFFVPLGVGAHLAYWGIPEAQIVELDWWEKAKLGALEISCVPARHASGRGVLDKDSTLWAGWALVGPAHRAYYSGDTGLFPAMKQIGERLGPFDLTMVEVGQYHRAWPDWHIGPEQAVTAHQWVRGRVLLPVHWGLFQLAFHGWTEPIERALAAGKAAGQTVLSPRPGESVEPAAPPQFTRWWPEAPWKTGAEDPIVSTQVE